MDHVKVAILDTGVADEIKDSRIKYGIQIYYDYLNTNFVINEKVTDYNGHGTACINTIWEVCPNVDIFVIKVLGISGQVSSKIFVEALKHVVELDVDIVTVCASIIANVEDIEIKELCDRMAKDGKIIIASVQNGKKTSAIANYENVIGVIGEEMGENEFLYCKDREIQMQCSSCPIIIRGLRGIRNPFQGNSKATAIATGIIAKHLYMNKGSRRYLDDILGQESKISGAVVGYFENKEYDDIKENNYAENDDNYLRFLYILCEFFLCEDVEDMRTLDILEYKNRLLLRGIDELLGLIEERFGIQIDAVSIKDLKWAYVFYENIVMENMLRSSGEYEVK